MVVTIFLKSFMKKLFWLRYTHLSCKSILKRQYILYSKFTTLKLFSEFSCNTTSFELVFIEKQACELVSRLTINIIRKHSNTLANHFDIFIQTFRHLKL